MIREDDLERAREAIRNGELVVYPTETAYGLGADATDSEAIENVYEAKDRPRSKGLTVICNSLSQVERHARVEAAERKLVREFMPGPLTLVVEKRERVPEELNEKFAFRISSRREARELARDTPVVATSANISGRETSYVVDEIADSILERAGVVLDAGELAGEPPSTVAEVSEDGVRVHREGPIDKSELRRIL